MTAEQREPSETDSEQDQDQDQATDADSNSDADSEAAPDSTEDADSDDATSETETAGGQDETEPAETNEADSAGSVVDGFPDAPASCLELPPLLQNLPSSEFIVMTEEKIFECLGVDSFQSRVEFDGTLPSGPASAVATSIQRLEDGVLLADAAMTQDGVVTEDLIRIGEELFVRNDAGQWEAGNLGFGFLFNEQGELRLAMSGALYALSVYGGGAEPKGEVDVDGVTLMLWEADAANIAAYVNTLGVAPVPVGVNAGFVNIWTTADGLIVKLEGEIRADDVTLGGIPTDQVDPTTLGLPADALDIVPDFAMSYQLFDFNHNIEVTAPALG